MLASLLLSLVIVSATPSPTPISRAELLSPFAPEMTVSWQESPTDGSTTYPTAALQLYGDLLRQPAKVALWNTAPTPVPTMGMDSLLGNDMIIADTPAPTGSTPTPTPLLSQPCIGAGCPLLAPGDVTDWSSVVQVKIGVVVNVQNMEAITWPTPNDGILIEMLRVIRDGMASLHAMYLRDAGLDVKVEHIAFINYHFADYEDQTSISVEDSKFWAANVGTHQPVRVLLRLLPDETGRGSLNGPCGTNEFTAYQMVWTAWPWTLPAYDDEWRSREGWLAIPAMELGHQLLGLTHTQCYHYGDGTPVEYCHESGCWTGDLICPANDDQSVMGYCWQICNSPNAPGDGPLAPPNPSPWPSLRVCPQPPQENVMCLMARRNVLGFAPGCAPYDMGQVVYSLPASWTDTDGDGYPDSIDNCPGKSNPEQIDSDMNGRGDDCQFCHIGNPARRGAAWVLLAPLAVLVVGRRRRRDGSEEGGWALER